MSYFIIVTGLPGSGKSTVGAAVAEALRLPLLDKDDILESLFESLGIGDEPWRRRLSRTADTVLERLARRSPGAVLTSWWQHPNCAIQSGTPSSWLSDLSGVLIELHCQCPPHLAVERFFARARHPGHLDGAKSRAAELKRFEEFAVHGCLGVGHLVEVNTEHPLDIAALLRRIEVRIATPGCRARVAVQ